MTTKRWIHEPLAGTFARRRDAAAKSFKQPLGLIVAKCFRCSKKVHGSELTYVYEKHGWHEVHRVCRSLSSRGV